VRVLTWLFGWKPWALGGAVLIALAQCPVANAEGDRARRAPILTSPAAQAVEPVGLAPAPAPPPANSVTDSMGGAVYNPFSEVQAPDRQAKAAGGRPVSAGEANPAAAIVAALACIAALGYLLRRALQGF
jgi:hypothetical protein